MQKQTQSLKMYRKDGTFTMSLFENKEQVNSAINKWLDNQQVSPFTHLVWRNLLDGSTEHIIPNRVSSSAILSAHNEPRSLIDNSNAHFKFYPKN